MCWCDIHVGRRELAVQIQKAVDTELRAVLPCELHIGMDDPRQSIDVLGVDEGLVFVQQRLGRMVQQEFIIRFVPDHLASCSTTVRTVKMMIIIMSRTAVQH